jgi:spermidine/putrescine transport system permease protein
MTRSFSPKRQAGFGLVAAVCFGFLYLPIMALVVYAFNSGPSLAVWEGVSIRWFVSAWYNTRVQDAALRSFNLAIVAASVSTVLATMVALATTRTRAYRGMNLKYAYINLPLLVPEIVTGVALLIVFAQIKVWSGYTGMAYLYLAHIAFCIPFAYMPIRARLDGMDLSLERAAADLYATPWRIFRLVTLPMIRPGVIAGFTLAFVVSLDNVVISEFVKSGGQDTLPTYMLGQLRRIVTPEVNAISTVFLAISIALVIFFYLLNRRKK